MIVTAAKCHAVNGCFGYMKPDGTEMHSFASGEIMKFVLCLGLCCVYYNLLMKG